MIKIKEINVSDYHFTTNVVRIEFAGRVNEDLLIPELIELVKKWENKDGNKDNNNN